MVYLRAERQILSTEDARSSNTVLRNDREIKTFLDGQELMEFATMSPAVQGEGESIKVKLKGSRQ